MNEEWTVELPEEWRTAEWRQGFIRVMAEATLARGRTALLITGMLKDGTTIYALTWERGQRLARLSPDTNWALEERFTGRQPTGADRRIVTRMWRLVVNAMAEARKAAEADQAAGYPNLPAAALVLNNTEAMDYAYDAYCEAVGEPVSREDFETAVEILAARDLTDGRRGPGAS